LNKDLSSKSRTEDFMLRNSLLISSFLFVIAGNCWAQQTNVPATPAVPTNGAESVAAPATISPKPTPVEDWTKLAVDRSMMKTLVNGAPLANMETAKYTRELVRMEWRYGDAIDMYIVKPKGVEKPRVVLYIYSFPSDTDRFRDDGWCTRATSQGLAAVGFASALTGDRFRNRPMKEWFVSELQESLGSSAHDVQLILDYLGKRDDLSAKEVAMFAQGSGATIAILAAAADPRIRALDLLDPWGDWPDWLNLSPALNKDERPNYLTPEFLKKVSMLDPVSYLPQLQDRALRVQQIMIDPVTPPAARDKIAAAVPPGDLVQYKDAEAHREVWRASGISGWIAVQFLAQSHGAGAALATGSKQSPQ
jgi:hypothetical protein